MLQFTKQSYEEKVAMYLKLPKKKIIKMLLECERILDIPIVGVKYLGEGHPSNKKSKACESNDPDYMCENCNCWKATRANCS